MEDVMEYLSVKNLSDGLNELIGRYGLSADVDGVDWTKTFYSAVNRLVKWTLDDDVRYDILLNALMYKVFKRSDRFFENFIENSNGRSLKVYLTSVIYRAVMDQSNKTFKEMSLFFDAPNGTDELLLDSLVDGVCEDDVAGEMEFRSVLYKLVSHLRVESNGETLLKVLSLRLRGFSPVEISRYMAVSVSSVRGWCKLLQDGLSAVAASEAVCGNSYLSDVIGDYVSSLSGSAKVCGEHQQLSDINLVLACDDAWAEDMVSFGLVG